MELFIPVLIVGFLLLMVFTWWVGHEMEKKRRAALAGVAAGLGLHYLSETDYHFHDTFEFLRCMNAGSGRYSCHRMQGDYQGNPVCSFEYHYKVTRKNGKSSRTTHYYFSIYSLSLPVPLGSLVVAPENLLTRAAAAFGFGDIELESAEFNRTFRVSSNDKRFAYDMLHPRMMELLLRHAPLSLEIDGTFLCLVDSEKITPERIQPRLDLLTRIHNHLPQYLLNRN